MNMQDQIIPNEILALAKQAQPPGDPIAWQEYDDRTIIVFRDGRKLSFSKTKTTPMINRYEMDMEEPAPEKPGKRETGSAGAAGGDASLLTGGKPPEPPARTRRKGKPA